ncbi:MAG: tRNA (adenosine(37)-N6)-threonylcarbamoyltransferase complex dimerization subunit type 1 TsaB [Armatimonadota bacterium]|nr:tRNA (adenosine(37)-N6)-threonylcarbamoyltransferase complex dimerization subunit type 1 TsaB [Armatimonadota bacterium]
MNILAVDTSGAQAGIAAVQCEATGRAYPLAVRSLAQTRQLSRQIIASIDETVCAASWTLDEIDAVAVGLGPGSWTGLRIGLTTCKTLAQVRGWKLCGVPTFDAMAYAVWHAAHEWDDSEDKGDQSEVQLLENFLLLATAPCRPGEIYGKIYECHPEYLAIVQSEWIGTPQMMVDAVDAEELAREMDAPLVLVGPASPAIEAALSARGTGSVSFPLSVETLSIEIGRHGAVLLENDETANPLDLQPLYLAPSAAERNLANAESRTRKAE